MAEVIASSVAGVAEANAALTAAAAEVAAAETELAALIGTETALEAEMVIESAGGPIGWIMFAVTAGVLATVIAAVIYANDKLTQARFNFEAVKTKITQTTPTPTPTQPPYKAPLTPAVVEVLKSIPTGPVVMFSEFFDCDKDFGVPTRCERKRFSHF